MLVKPKFALTYDVYGEAHKLINMPNMLGMMMMTKMTAMIMTNIMRVVVCSIVVQPIFKENDT